MKVTNPADGSVIAEIEYGGAAEATAACDAAAAAFGEWAGRSARARADVLRTVADLLVARADDIGLLLARESGKRLPEGVAEINFSAEYFRWFAEEARRPHGEVLSPEIDGRRQIVQHGPAGVAGVLTPWNFPVSIQARKLAPALAAGCTTVSRASEQAPLAVIELFKVLAEAGIPSGVANLVQGPAGEVTQAILRHRAVRVVSFTGSTEVGRLVMAQAAERIVRPLLELGGDAPFVVLDDADVEAAVEGALIAKFRNNGQSCIAANRFIVQDGVHDDFCARLASRVDAMTVGDPVGDPVPDLGPMINASRAGAIRSLGEEASRAGARRLTREFDLPAGDSFVAPALYADVPRDVPLGCSEVFGPIAAVFRVSSDDEALELANDTEMGLAAYVYTRDGSRAWRFTEGLEAGIVGCNNPLPSAAFAPMGGVKQSGLGREGSRIGLEEFCETRYTGWQL